MPFYTYKNLPVQFNENNFICSDISLSVTNDSNPVYRLGEKSTSDYSPNGGSQGICNFTYYLSGNDYLKTFINDDTTFLRGNIGGWTFNSGKLKSYALDCTPNSPVTVKASILFFDPLAGSISNTPSVVSRYPILNFSDVQLNSLNGYAADPITNITSLSYQYNADIQAFYHVDNTLGKTNIIPKRVIVNQKTINTEVICDNYAPDLSMFGDRAGMKINFTHPELPNITENILASGILKQKTFNTSVDDVVSTQLSITQHHANLTPYITSFSPSTASIGDVIVVKGLNFTSVTAVYTYADNQLYRVAGLSIVDDQTLTFSLPPDSRTGPIIIKSLWGESQSSTNLVVNYQPMTIQSTSLAVSKPGDLIILNGSNINNITSITFGGVNATYYSPLSSSAVLVQVPQNAVSGPIVVGSNFTLQTGSLTYDFILPPSISGFTPSSGVSGSTLTISGSNFSGAQGVLINGLRVPFTYVNPLKITATVPSGWTRGPIVVSGMSGYIGVSSGIFEPILKITGISPPSGATFSNIRVSGYNFDTGLMYPFPSGGWQVSFNGIVTGLHLSTPVLLTGRVPSGSNDGPIQIFRKDGSVFPSNYSWKTIYQPIPRSCSPTGIFSGQLLQMSITGDYLYSLSGIKFSGISPTNIGTIINVNSRFVSSDQLGNKATITGFYVTGHPTGNYDLIALNSNSSGILTGALTIYGPINRAREYYVRTYQSTTGSTGNPYPFVFRPEYTIDGVRTNSGAISLTRNEASGWWEIRLLKPYKITSIVIYPYATGSVSLLNNFSGIIYDNNRLPIWSGNVTTPNLPSHTLNMAGDYTGRYFRIAKFTSGSIGLGEVEIY